MTVNKAELQNALTKVKPGLASRELIEQSTSFAFMGDRVVTYNDEISISHPVQNLDVRGAVKAKVLYDYLKKIKKDELEIEWEENQVKITTGKAVAGLILEQEVKLPMEEIGEIGEWLSLPSKFVEGLRFCHSCCSRDMSRPVLTCVCIKGQFIEATDSFQIIRFEMDDIVSNDTILIPATTVEELIKYDIKDMAKGQQGWIHFRTDDETVFSCRVFDGIFPDVSSHLEFGGIEINFSERTIDALKRAKVICENNFVGGASIVTVMIKEGQMIVFAKGEFGWFEEKLKIKYEGEDIKFMINVDFLLTLLSRMSTCIFGDNKIKFMGDNWVHIAALVVEA